jgi:hypothetical protein
MNIEYIYKDKFYLFKIKDFLNIEEYDQLKLNFPKLNIKEIETEKLI